MNRRTIARTCARGIRWAVVAALLGGLVLTIVPTPVVHAATIHVDTTADELDGWLGNGTCSLREAISNANHNNFGQADCAAGTAALDTITFDAAIDGIPIVLTGLAGDNSNASGDLDILEGGDLTIQGNGAGNTLIDGGGNDRAIHVCPYGCAGTVTLNGVTIRNGLVGSDGGGILNTNAALNVQDCIIGGQGVGNQANYGGGIYNGGGITTVDGSIVSDNTAAGDGGGIHNAGILIVQNNSTIGEFGVGNHAANGGGIYHSAGSTTVIGSSIISNTVTDHGGGIYNEAGTTTVDGSTVSRNTGVNSNASGGGIYNGDMLMVQNNSLIGGASAGNHAVYGAGIHNAGGAKATVDGSTVSGNTSDSLYSIGGGICNWNLLTVTNSLIGGAGAGNEAMDGGGIGNWVGTAWVEDSTISGNAASLGGGIYNFAGNLLVLNSTIGGAGTGNTALRGTGRGGGINSDGTATLSGCRVVHNEAKEGGGIYNTGALLIVQNDSTISGNTATDSGGGIYNHDTMIVESSTIDDNSALYGGGFRNDGAVTIASSTIGGRVGNQATIWGGAIYCEGSGSTTVMGSRFLNNTATVNGGSVFTDQNTAGGTNVTGCCIVGNSDTSFYNNQNAVQHIATGNWWGAATGPNTPGADTVGGNVDTSGYLTAPPGFCFYYTYLPLVTKAYP